MVVVVVMMVVELGVSSINDRFEVGRDDRGYLRVLGAWYRCCNSSKKRLSTNNVTNITNVSNASTFS